MFPAADFFDDGIGVGGPDEWFGIGIGFLQEAVDGGLEIGDALEQAALESTAGQLSVDPLCRIKPRGRGLPCVKQPWVLAKKDLLRDALERILGMRDDVAATRLLSTRWNVSRFRVKSRGRVCGARQPAFERFSR